MQGIKKTENTNMPLYACGDSVCGGGDGFVPAKSMFSHGIRSKCVCLLNSYNCSIFITRSNSKLLSGKMATLLVGRCIEFRIMPFSFAESYEYIRTMGRNISPDEFIIDYINWGGFPLRFSFTKESDIKRYLEQTYKGILDKDIIRVIKRG